MRPVSESTAKIWLGRLWPGTPDLSVPALCLLPSLVSGSGFWRGLAVLEVTWRVADLKSSAVWPRVGSLDATGNEEESKRRRSP